MTITIGVSNFVRRQTPEASYSHFEGTWEELVELVKANFRHGKQGYKPGVLLVPVPVQHVRRFRSSTVKVNQNTKLRPQFAPRREGEMPFISVRAQGGKSVASHAFVVLYSHAVLMEGGEATTNADWEIISINARGTEAEEPMDPMTMARNFLCLPGGTKGEFTAQQFAESIVYWSQHALVAEQTEEIPDYGDHMTLEAFIECCETGGFIDYDGTGYYATADRMTRIRVSPSDVTEGKINQTYTHVVWFNK